MQVLTPTRNGESPRGAEGCQRNARLRLLVRVISCASLACHTAENGGGTEGQTATQVAPLQSVAAPDLVRRSYASVATGSERGYLLYVPADYGASNEPWPVILFLHGNGERGDGGADLDYLLKNGPLFEAWIQKRDLPFLIVAPQLPLYGQEEKADYLKNRTRAEIPARLPAGTEPRPPEFATPGPMTGALQNLELPVGIEGPPVGWPKLETDVLQILKEVERDYRVNARRRYITGVSYGGFGTWYLASRHPELFAAMAPVVGWGHPDLMAPLARRKLPVWGFAGGRDAAVHLEYFYAGFNRLEQLGHREVRFTVEADMGHDVWARSYAGDDLYRWFLQYEAPTP
jgi:predicted peptidase